MDTGDMINPNEAPEGYRAVEPLYFDNDGLGACDECNMYETLEDGSLKFNCNEYDCIADNRKDGQDVIFKEIEKDG
jgi:hypothetical protein